MKHTFKTLWTKFCTPKNHTIKTLFKSKGKTPAGDPFFSVKEARGYYVYGERGGKDSIAFILYDRDENKFCLINESKPPLDETYNTKARMTTAFGGSIDTHGTYKQICDMEVWEETGYDVNLDRINFVGKTLVSTQMSQECHLYLVDVTNLDKTGIAEHEEVVTPEQACKDADEFVGNSVHWLTREEVLRNSDWKSIFIITKAEFLNLL